MAHYRTIFMSDIHLGTRGCKADILLDFLKNTESDNLYLVGDAVDFWRLQKSWYWPQAHNDVVQKILRKARKGTNVIYVPGNHDENLRGFAPTNFGDIKIVNEAIHETANGKKLLVIHGDDFDGITRYAKWLSVAGDVGYNSLLAVNRWFNVCRRKLGMGYWSLSAFVKHKVKKAAQFIDQFETNIAKEVKDRGLDGVVCGHIHHAEIRIIDGIIYANDGDFVESCTVLVEEHDGTLKIIRWAKIGYSDVPTTVAEMKI